MSPASSSTKHSLFESSFGKDSSNCDSKSVSSSTHLSFNSILSCNKSSFSNTSTPQLTCFCCESSNFISLELSVSSSCESSNFISLELSVSCSSKSSNLILLESSVVCCWCCDFSTRYFMRFKEPACSVLFKRFAWFGLFSLLGSSVIFLFWFGLFSLWSSAIFLFTLFIVFFVILIQTLSIGYWLISMST